MKDSTNNMGPQVSAEDIILFAYGESEVPEVFYQVAHLAQCPDCKAWLDQIKQVQELASKAELPEPSPEIISRLQAEARKRLQLKQHLYLLPRPEDEKQDRSRRRRAAGLARGRWSWPALAAAALLLLGIGLALWNQSDPRRGPRPQDQPVPEYLVGVSAPLWTFQKLLASEELDRDTNSDEELADFETMESLGLETGIWGWLSSQVENLEDLELDLSDLEISLSLLDLETLENLEAPEKK